MASRVPHISILECRVLYYSWLSTYCCFADDAQVSLLDGAATFEQRLCVAGDDRQRFLAFLVQIQNLGSTLGARVACFQLLGRHHVKGAQQFQGLRVLFVGVRWSEEHAHSP